MLRLLHHPVLLCKPFPPTHLQQTTFTDIQRTSSLSLSLSHTYTLAHPVADSINCEVNSLALIFVFNLSVCQEFFLFFFFFPPVCNQHWIKNKTEGVRRCDCFFLFFFSFFALVLIFPPGERAMFRSVQTPAELCSKDEMPCYAGFCNI